MPQPCYQGGSIVRLPGGGNGNPLQYSCLVYPMDRGAWQLKVHGSHGIRHDLATKQQHCQTKTTLTLGIQFLKRFVMTLSECNRQKRKEVFVVNSYHLLHYLSMPGI